MYLSSSILNTNRVIARHDTTSIIPKMKETWMDRAKKRMRALRKTQEDLKHPLGVKTRGAVGHYLSGRRDLNTGQITSLATALECSIDWLLTGESLEGLSTETADLPDAAIQLARIIAQVPPEKLNAILTLLDTKEDLPQPEKPEVSPPPRAPNPK